MTAAPNPPPAAKSPTPATTSPKSNVVRWHWNSALAGALISAILLGVFTFLWRRPTPPPISIHAPPTPSIPTPEPTATPAPVVIFISGAVQTPGVYELPSGARAADAVERAGGFTAEANAVAINLAAILRDGDQLHVPTLAEDPSIPAPGLTNQESPSGVGGLININTATLEELDRLPGIGPTRAQEIIANRPYVSVDDLDRVPGIGPATIEDLRPYVVVE
jgi:competence protein ComEA